MKAGANRNTELSLYSWLQFEVNAMLCNQCGPLTGDNCEVVNK